CSRDNPKRGDEAGSSANLSTESDIRDLDGSSRSRRELPTGPEGGKTQSRGWGHRPDDYGGTRAASSSARVDTQRQNSEGDLRSDACEAGRDTQAERGNADAGNPDGARSIQTAVAAAG